MKPPGPKGASAGAPPIDVSIEELEKTTGAGSAGVGGRGL